MMLADIHFKQGDYAKAAVRVKEVIRHYPNCPQQLLLRDQLGDCYRKLADQHLRDAKADHASPKQAYYLSMQRDRLAEALEVYQKLEFDLDVRAHAGPLTTSEEALQRKALFVAADCLFDLGNSYGEVLRRYEELARRVPEPHRGPARLPAAVELLQRDPGRGAEAAHTGSAAHGRDRGHRLPADHS